MKRISQSVIAGTILALTACSALSSDVQKSGTENEASKNAQNFPSADTDMPPLPNLAEGSPDLPLFDTTPDENAVEITDYKLLSLPNGFAPDGISISQDGTIYVASIADGRIVKGKTNGNTITETLVEGGQKNGGWGMDLTANDKYLWLAGGFAGTARSYNAKTGELVSDVSLAKGGIVNDLIVTERAVYLTNSALPELYEISLDSDGKITGKPRTIPLSGDFDFDPGYFANANGIVYDAKNDAIVVNHSQLGKMYSVDVQSGLSKEIDLSGETVSNDGIAIDGDMLFGVEPPKNQITELKLSDDLSKANVTRRLTAEPFNFPTLIAFDDSFFYVINGKLSTQRAPDVVYEVIKFTR